MFDIQLYQSPGTKQSIKRDSLQKSVESRVVSESAIWAQKRAEIAPLKKVGVFPPRNFILLLTPNC